jgi:hypothetical protein
MSEIENLELLEAGNEMFKFKSPDGEGYFSCSIVYQDLTGNTLSPNKIHLKIIGKNVLNEDINEIVSFTPEEFNQAKEAGEINPTKVFWLVAKVLEALVCPNCSDGID